MMPLDPIFQYIQAMDEPGSADLPLSPDNKWYFWSETWCDAYGPYETEQEARDAIKRYGEQL
jgi:hypothetical protein